MKPTKPITRAFCVELQQEMSIAGARREYFSQEPPRKRFEFLCSNEACRAMGAKVTGVRYDVKPQDNPTFVAAHFRANPHYDHHADCEWVDADADESAEDQIDANDPQTALRKAKRKLDDYIDVFDPTIKEPAKEKSGVEKAGSPAPAPVPGTAPAPPAEPKALRYSETRTNNLERLVDSYRQAKAELSPEEFKLLKLRIPGQGELSLRSYFRHIKYAQLGDNGRVLYGGGLVEQRYGQGFKFKFFDRLEGKLVTLYVSPAQMQAYRSSRYISELLSHADEVKFFTVYALGTLTKSPSGKSFSVEVDDLRHLAIVLGPQKELAA
ncbi:ATPase [Pseudomonas alliivorans]|uniref:ATPase n=1 Tax=Pseudomonas alliivorans TaxID=2810613 RepID=A0ABS4BZE0_9PSED|nr:ATPase [Pseudomonas alliivorans]MBP0943774.1 ATPase [Pseudomonas alliivorans]MEE4325940.1 ATPase [Pseudomonas alliivorans]MEE4336744.1 ATPase [Pseudomonas alliivorans]MEE4367470.1 ATPase [Pseudomonas alliivorans]MEE4678637.1 ATPase [Pseudomonas alliivorans]